MIGDDPGASQLCIKNHIFPEQGAGKHTLQMVRRDGLVPVPRPSDVDTWTLADDSFVAWE
jgi:hypothetical protein